MGSAPREASAAMTQCSSEVELSCGDPVWTFALRYNELIVLDTWIFGFFEVVWWRWTLPEVMGGWTKASPWLPHTQPSHTLGLYWEQFEERHL